MDSMKNKIEKKKTNETNIELVLFPKFYRIRSYHDHKGVKDL